VLRCYLARLCADFSDIPALANVRFARPVQLIAATHSANFSAGV
jgi:hypothetical protein